MTQEDDDQTEEDIERIANRLDALSIEANTLAQELGELRRRRQRRQRRVVYTRSLPPHDTIGIGDTVRIINNYQGLRGTLGVVTHLTASRVSLTDTSGVVHTRAQNNVLKTRPTRSP